MKRFKKILIVLSSVFVLFVSVFAVSASALDVNGYIIAEPAVTHVVAHPTRGAEYYSAPFTIVPPIDFHGNGRYQYYGDMDDSVRYGWTIQEAGTYYERICMRSSSEHDYGSVYDMNYLRVNGLANNAFDMMFVAGVYKSMDENFNNLVQASTDDVPYYAQTARVTAYLIRDTENFVVDFDVNNSGSVYLTNILLQHYNIDVSDGVPIYLSKLEIDYKDYGANKYTYGQIYIYTRNGSLFYQANNFLPGGAQDLVHTYYNETSQGAYNNGYNVGFQEGTRESFDVGYESGYNVAIQENEIVERGMFGWVMDSVQGFMEFEIFEGFSIGWMLSVVVGVSCLIWLLKLLAGG